MPANENDTIEPGLIIKNGPCRTLILCPIGIGNFVMATPALELLSREIGRENLHILALKRTIKTMAEATGLFYTVHSWDPDTEGLSGGLGIVGRLRKLRFDYCVSLFPAGDPRFSMAAILSGAKTRIGFAYPNSGLPKRTQTVSLPLDYSLHDTDQNWGLVERLLGSRYPGERVQRFDFAPEHPDAERLSRESYFVCHPGSSAQRGMDEKRLPPSAFAEIIKLIYEEYGLKCALVGGPEEQALRDVIATKAGDAILDCASTNLNELAAVIAPARFYLGNDSGLMHICVAMGKRCVAFFGPTDDRRNGPYSNGLRLGETGYHLILRRDDLSCSPCWTIKTVGANPRCIFGDTRCLQAFDISRAWPRVKSYLDGVVSR